MIKVPISAIVREYAVNDPECTGPSTKGDYGPDGPTRRLTRHKGRQPTAPSGARCTTDLALRRASAPDIPPGRHEWWEQYWTDALERLKRHLEQT